MRIYTWLIALWVALPTILNAQTKAEARKVLDTTAAELSEKGGVKANFIADQVVNGEVTGSISGSMCIEKNKFQLTTPDMTVWYDGQTQWSYIKASEEVNISSPTPEEQQTMNPYAFVELYKKGYKYKMKETTLRGKACYEVRLTAESRKQPLETLIINIDKRTYEPMCIRMHRRGNKEWTRIAIHQFQNGQAFSSSDFEFNANDFPQAEVIDLR